MSKSLLEKLLTHPITAKGILFFLLCSALFFFVYKKLPQPKIPTRPVLLLINHYPLTEEDKNFYRRANPYGFLLGIPARLNLNPPTLRQELEEILQRKDFLFFIDQEGGLVNRIKQFDPNFQAPAPSFFGKLAQTDLSQAQQAVYEYGVRTGKKLKELTVDVVFAPLAEIAKPEDTLSRSRYFSEDPHIVQILADAYAAGLAEGGVIPCYKHAPGVTASAKDPHYVKPPVNSLSVPQLRQRGITPMKNANKWPFLMTGHNLYSAIDEKNISTYSPKTYNFIRRELHFDGLIIPDALNMQAAQLSYTSDIATRMRSALAAGADIVIPFFHIDAPTSWMIQQIESLPTKYAKRLQKKIKILEQKGFVLRHIPETQKTNEVQTVATK